MEKSEAIQKQEWVVAFLKRNLKTAYFEIGANIENIYLPHAKDVLNFLKEENER